MQFLIEEYCSIAGLDRTTIVVGGGAVVYYFL